jgi:hypothetical protein
MKRHHDERPSVSLFSSIQYCPLGVVPSIRHSGLEECNHELHQSDGHTRDVLPVFLRRTLRRDLGLDRVALSEIGLCLWEPEVWDRSSNAFYS